MFGYSGLNGMLLYGCNAVGKSSMMKAIGLNIIMAQAGLYVAATNFLFKPFQYMFTRISDNDNILKGQSSFAVEMSELRSILKGLIRIVLFWVMNCVLVQKVFQHKVFLPVL